LITHSTPIRGYWLSLNIILQTLTLIIISLSIEFQLILGCTILLKLLLRLEGYFQNIIRWKITKNFCRDIKWILVLTLIINFPFHLCLCFFIFLITTAAIVTIFNYLSLTSRPTEQSINLWNFFFLFEFVDEVFWYRLSPFPNCLRPQ